MVPTGHGRGNATVRAYNRPIDCPYPEGSPMDDRKKMMQMLLPAAAAAGVILLVGVLVATSDWSTEPTGKEKAGTVDASGADMINVLPPLDAKEWVPKANGMKVWDVKEGEGQPCPRGAEVTIHYSGWLTDGARFDSSLDRGEPATFDLDGLIKGWQVGIPGMKPGGIRRLVIPPELGYGETGSPPRVPGGATLVFEVKLIAFR